MALPSAQHFGPELEEACCCPSHVPSEVGIAGAWHFYWKSRRVLEWRYGTQTVARFDTTDTTHPLITFPADTATGTGTWHARESDDGTLHLLEGTQQVLLQAQQLHVGDNAVVFPGKRGSDIVTCSEVHIGSAASSPSVYVNGVLWPATMGTAGQLLSTNGSGQLQWISGGSASGSTFDSLTVDGWTLDTDTPTSDWTLAPPGSTTPVVRVSTAGQITAQSLATTSDLSLKTDVCALQADQTSRLLQKLEPVRFTWKSTNQPAFGFIAQDVQRVAPQLVQVQQPGGLRSIKTLELVPLLVAEVQDLRRQLQELRASLA